MTLTIELSKEQEIVLEKVANSSGVDLQEYARLRLLEAIPIKKTPAEVLAGWHALESPSVYGRNPEDALKISRQLRESAESREILP